MYMYMCKLHRYLNANHMYPYNVWSMYIVTLKVLRRPSCVSKRKRKAGFSPFGLASKLIPERDTPQLLNSFIYHVNHASDRFGQLKLFNFIRYVDLITKLPISFLMNALTIWHHEYDHIVI